MQDQVPVHERAMYVTWARAASQAIAQRAQELLIQHDSKKPCAKTHDMLDCLKLAILEHSAQDEKLLQSQDQYIHQLVQSGEFKTLLEQESTEKGALKNIEKKKDDAMALAANRAHLEITLAALKKQVGSDSKNNNEERDCAAIHADNVSKLWNAFRPSNPEENYLVNLVANLETQYQNNNDDEENDVEMTDP